MSAGPARDVAGRIAANLATVMQGQTLAIRRLLAAFASGGHDALVKTLSKMKSRGRVAITGTLGYQIAYIRSMPSENGRTIRLVTDRPIKFAEAHASSV